MTLEKTQHYSPNASRAGNIPFLPNSEKRKRLGDELQPWGDYTNINPIQTLLADIETVQSCEAENAEFYKDEWWGWTHKRLRFLNSKLGLKWLLLSIPFIWASAIFFGGMTSVVWGLIKLSHTWNMPALLFILLLLALATAWIFLSIFIIANTTNWIMTKGIGFLLKPFEKSLQKKVDKSLADGMSEFNRVTGQVTFALGKGRFFEAPFVEFDAYVERVVQRGGLFYRLMFVHRYTGKTFNKTWLSGVEADKNDVMALWDMLQRFMDVSQPIPDMPRFEPFRHLDPVTAEHDRKTSRPPRYWRDLDLEEWKQNEGTEMARAKARFPWSQRRCKLTPKLGQVDMSAYRKVRPDTAVAI